MCISNFFPLNKTRDLLWLQGLDRINLYPNIHQIYINACYRSFEICNVSAEQELFALWTTGPRSESWSSAPCFTWPRTKLCLRFPASCLWLFVNGILWSANPFSWSGSLEQPQQHSGTALLKYKHWRKLSSWGKVLLLWRHSPGPFIEHFTRPGV